jgi:CheY-like chemotaxis protein
MGDTVLAVKSVIEKSSGNISQEQPLPVQNISILLVEDNEADIFAVQEIFSQRQELIKELAVARTGKQALSILRSESDIALHKPYIILLDLNLPGMSGLDFLSQIRKDPALKSAIVFVLTGSREEHDRISSYEHNVAGYIIKTDITSCLFKVLELIEHYLKIIELPEN